MSIRVNDIMTEVMANKLEALQHAAEISYLITDRTLGSDKPKWQSKEEPSRRDKANVPIKTSKPPIKESPESLPLQSNFPDINALQSQMITFKLQQECKRNVRDQLNKIQQRQSLVNQQILEQQRNSQALCKKWLAEKRSVDEDIARKAEERAKSELQQQQLQLDQLHKNTQLQLQQITFQGVAKYQSKFRAKYEAIAKLLISLDKATQQACSEHNRQLRELIQLFEQLITKIKSGDFGTGELMKAEKLCKSLESLESDILKELDEFKQSHQRELDKAKEVSEERRKSEANAAAAAAVAAEEEKRMLKEQLESKKLQQLQQEQEAAAAAVSPPSQPLSNATPQIVNQIVQPTATLSSDQNPTNVAAANSTNYVDPNRLDFYNQINEFYLTKVERVKPLQTDETWKKYRTNCQKAINIPLNAISSVSGQHLLDKFEKLYNFINGQPQKTPEGQITVNDHPLGRDYCLLLMSKKFVSQAETAISSNPQAAFPIASVIVSLWKLVPDFGRILLAYIFKESPFLVPYFIPQKQGQSNEDYFKTIGYRIVDNNKLEQPDMFLKRQAGIARLYGAIMITGGRCADGSAHPYGIAEAWRWLSHIINLTPLPDICATIIMEMLQIVGSELWRAYGKQFPKLLLYVQQYYFPRLSAIDEGGPKTRLELLLGNFIREGKIPQATGVLPPGFW